jgi:glycosyltransferase involved in cell wall biosynthesis
VRFSIITPAFRSSKWLRLCIESVADQAVELEHIVQDGGSDDGTLDWLLQDVRVKGFVEKDTGMYDAINRGLRRATGDILAYLNCDEQYLPETLSQVERFFEGNPEVDVVFGDVVLVDAQGDYVAHRRMLPPLLYHTWTCQLSTLSCAMFFRARVIRERGMFFDPVFHAAGDGDWIVKLLQRGTNMAALGQFTSAFTFTGSNIGMGIKASRERQELLESAPAWARALRPAIIAHHRLRRLGAGMYRQRPFAYRIYTLKNPSQRSTFNVSRPTFRWPREEAA